jgi:hypothetical protein
MEMNDQATILQEDRLVASSKLQETETPASNVTDQGQS